MEVLGPERQDLPARQTSSMIEVAQTRAAQEVQAAMLVAKKFPRDVNAAITRITQGCHRKALAEQSQYSFPRGGSRVTGPSIRLAEHLAQNWGNFESGIVELERRDGESVAMAYGWDLESNSRDVKIFTVEHVRERSEQKGGNVQLTDPRDIYELLANVGARRKRACILALIPGDIVDLAIDECEKTLKGDMKEPLIDRIRKMVSAFVEQGVTQEMIERKLGHVLDATSEIELSDLRKVFTSIKDGMSKREDWFDVTAAKADLQDGKASFGFKKKSEEKKAATDEKKSEAEKPAAKAEPPAQSKPSESEKPSTPPPAAESTPAPAPGATPMATPAVPAEQLPNTAPSAPATPAPSTPAPTGDPSQTPAALGRKIQQLAREKNIPMGTINTWANAQWGKGWMSDKLHLQTVVMNLNQGNKFTT